jgi:protein HIRA/HIR1
VVRACYSPKLFHPPGQKDAAATCIALGSQDRRLTVWLSNAGRPLLCASKLFQQGVGDLAWTPDGAALLACSGDGSLAVMQFEASQLGTPLSQVCACYPAASLPPPAS